MNEWNSVDKSIPDFNVPVLVLVESEPFDYQDENGDTKILGSRYHMQIAKLREQFRTHKPVWVFEWDHECVEGLGTVVTYWQHLPKLPEAE